MNRPISDIAFTPAVKAAQQLRGSRQTYARMEHVAEVARLWSAVVKEIEWEIP